MTYLAVSIQGEDASQFEERIRAARQAGAEIAELRVDYLRQVCGEEVSHLIQLAHKISLPVIVTCRDRAEGGAGNLDLPGRISVLTAAVKAGADYIDCEYDNFVRPEIKQAIGEALSDHSKCRLILSAHNFGGPFENAELLYDSMRSAWPGAIAKLVFTANHISDCFTAFDLLHSREGEAIVFCMGSAGMISRVLARKFGSFLTFVSLDEGQATAPGQLTIGQIKGQYRWDKIDEKTEIFGVIGDPVGHSLSPLVFNACFEKGDVNAVYLPFRVEDGKKGFNLFMEGVIRRGWLNFGGFSITIPHKSNALDFAGREGNFVEGLASAIGAVNTFKIGFNNILSAYNTDYAGAMDALTAALGIDRHQMHGVKVAVVGAGGVARAVVAGLVDVGAEVAVYNRTVSKAQLLAEEFRCRAYGLDKLSSLDAGVVINCTSIGMSPNAGVSPVPASVFGAGMTAFDTVYTPLHTRFLRDAEAADATIINGAEMFIRQAMAQYRLFIGGEPDEKVMRKTVFDRLKEE